MGITTDPRDPGLLEKRSDGQQQTYLVLTEGERAKGYVRPLRHKTIHVACGTVTRIPAPCAETYARDPAFYGGTFCCHCGKHFPLVAQDGSVAFLWDEDQQPVGSAAEAVQENCQHDLGGKLGGTHKCSKCSKVVSSRVEEPGG